MVQFTQWVSFDLAFGISSMVLGLFSKYRFFHSPADPMFAYISYHWPLSFFFFFFFNINLLLDSEACHPRVSQPGTAANGC